MQWNQDLKPELPPTGIQSETAQETVLSSLMPVIPDTATPEAIQTCLIKYRDLLAERRHAGNITPETAERQHRVETSIMRLEQMVTYWLSFLLDSEDDRILEVPDIVTLLQNENAAAYRVPDLW